MKLLKLLSRFLLIAFTCIGFQQIEVALASSKLDAAPTYQLNFPAFTGLVVDAANVLDTKTIQSITAQLKHIQDTTLNQVVIVTISTTNGIDIADYGYQLGRAWGVGQKGKNNGLLFIIAVEDRAVRIEVGYGLEGIITDAKSKQIILSITPQLKVNNFSAATEEAVRQISFLLNLKQPPDIKPKKSANFSDIFFICCFVICMVNALFGSNKRGRWHRSSGGSSGGGGFSGSSGGFSGGGGGSFGGGGSSGKF